jgi:mannose-6-phosphate isomerase class I
MNDGEIAAIRARLKTISTPPWSVISGEHGEWYIYGADGFAIHDSFNSTADGLAIAAANRALIEHAPVDIAYLLDEVAHLQTDVRDLAQISGAHEETIVRLMEAFDCPNPSALVEHIQALFEMLQNDLRIARAEATSVRPGLCVPKRAEGE